MEHDVENLMPAEVAPEAPAVDLGHVALILEALLLAADGPLSLDQLVKMVGSEFNLGKRELREALVRLGEHKIGTASELVEVASGWRLQVRPEYAEWIARLWQEKPPKYSRALLETLALIVYRQPITRGEIEEVRGVAVSSNILRTLLERGWIRELGHKEVPGRPTLFGTSAQFLDDFNLKSLSQLPPLPDIKDLEQLEAALARLGAEALPPVEDDEDGEGHAGVAMAEVLDHDTVVAAADSEAAEAAEANAAPEQDADATGVPPAEAAAETSVESVRDDGGDAAAPDAVGAGPDEGMGTDADAPVGEHDDDEQGRGDSAERTTP